MAKRSKLEMRVLAVALLVPFVMSCNDEVSGLVNEKYEGETLANIKGTLSIESPEAYDGPISIALVWRHAWTETEEDYKAHMADQENDTACTGFLGDELSGLSCDGTLLAEQTTTCRQKAPISIYKNPQEIEYKAASLMEFSLPVYELPPEEVRVDLSKTGGSGWKAEAVVVAFLDKDDNGEFDRGNPDQAGDLLVASSLGSYPGEDGETKPGGSVYFLDGTLGPDSNILIDDGDLKQGFNLLEFDMNPVNCRVLENSESISLYPYQYRNETVFRTVSLHCDEVEARYIFNGSGPVPGEGNRNCMQAVTTSDTPDRDYPLPSLAPGQKLYQWWYNEVDPEDNPCIIYARSGAVCYTDESQIPEGWESACGGYILESSR